MSFSFRTSPPVNYIPPSLEEMREAAKSVSLSSFSRDMVADLCNLAAGGHVNPPSHYRGEVLKKVTESLPAPNDKGQWSVKITGSTKTTNDRQLVVNTKLGEAMKYHQNVCDFLQAVDLQNFPGGTPLEQAMAMLKLLSKQSGGSGGGEQGEPLPIFQDSDRPESVAETLHDVMDQVDLLSEEELDMLDPDGKNHEVQSEEDGERSGHKGLNKLKVAEDLLPGTDKRIMLDISRKLDQFTKLQVRKQKLVEVDPAGEEIRQRPIKHLGELSRVPASAWATRQQSPTYFLYKAVTGQLPVRERVTRLEKKQAIFILVDGSGSMRGRKHWKATGVVMNRLKAVLSGDAYVFVSVFDTSLSDVDHASTPDQARKLIKKFAEKNFSGGGTDIGGAVRAAHKFIEDLIRQGGLIYRPEIVVLTDEDTSISSVNVSDVKGTRIHGFAMEVKNPSLVRFAQSTGGVGIDQF